MHSKATDLDAGSWEHLERHNPEYLDDMIMEEAAAPYTDDDKILVDIGIQKKAETHERFYQAGIAQSKKLTG